MLRVTFNQKFSVSQHIDNVLRACAQTLFATRTLRYHGLPEDAIYAVYQAVVVAKLTYASLAWLGFTSTADRGRIEAFLCRSERFKFWTASAPSFNSICDSTDIKLFNDILNNRQHLLFPLLPPVRDDHYFLRDRSPNLQLPARSSSLKDCNFLMRMLYKDIHSSQS